MKWIYAYFNLTKSEQRGFIALTTVIIICSVIKAVLPLWLDHQMSKEQTALYQKISAQLAKNSQSRSLSMVGVLTSPIRQFDPNTASESELADIGLQVHQVRNVKNYLKSGRRFSSPDDFGKLYTITRSDFDRLKPGILIKEKKSSGYRQTVPQKMIELNTADTAALKSLPGIGSFYARKIIQRREELGGFYDKEQLLEIWRFDPQVLQQNDRRIQTDVRLIKRLSINTVSFESLRKHPYFGWKTAGAVIKYREQHGPYRQPEDLLKVVVISDSIFRKIKPYINVEIIESQ